MDIPTLLVVMVTVIAIITVILMVVLTVKIYTGEARAEDKGPKNSGW